MAMTAKERQRLMSERRKALGFKKFTIWVTEYEEKELRDKLRRLRESKKE